MIKKDEGFMGVDKKISWIIKKVEGHKLEKKQNSKGMVRVNYYH